MKSARQWVRRVALAALVVVASMGDALAQDTRGRPVGGGGDATTDHRLALVIGNSSYKVGPLKNPVNDAKAMAEVLGKLGFEVQAGYDLDQKGIKRAIQTFGKRLAETRGVALFFFAGHGMQVKGLNYLIPIGATINGEDDVDIEAVRADAVLAKMASASGRMNIVILDACRNNPFARSVRSGGGGLAEMKAPTGKRGNQGTIISYATAPGSVASDGKGAHGAFTAALLQHIGRPGLKIEDVFKRSRATVKLATVDKQVPWEATSLTGDFFFARGKGGGVPATRIADARRTAAGGAPTASRGLVRGPAAPAGAVFWDDFSKGAGGWTADGECAACKFVGGAMTLPFGPLEVLLPGDVIYSDFAFSAKVAPSVAGQGYRFGLVVEVDEDYSYIFVVERDAGGRDGGYGLVQLTAGDTMTPSIPPTDLPAKALAGGAAKRGASDLIAVQIKGDEVLLLVNGVIVDRVPTRDPDDPDDDGEVDGMLSVINLGDNAVVVDDVLVTD